MTAEDHSLRGHRKSHARLARTPNDRGLPLGHRAPLSAAGPGRIVWSAFRDRVRVMGIKEVVTAPRSPWQNPYVERIIGSIRRECLDHVIIFDEHHLRGVLSSYFQYHHKTQNASLAQQGLSGAPSDTTSLCRQDYCVPGGRRSASSLRTSRRVNYCGDRTGGPVPA